MYTAKKIILPGVFTALLLGAQLVLSGISGIELVTVLLLTFAYKYGIKQGLFVANAFSLLRCFLFGFYPNVLILYLLYYNHYADKKYMDFQGISPFKQPSNTAKNENE